MKKSWLVQRLVKPIPGRPRHAFGAGCSGGFPAEHRELLLRAFDFDYMGNAHFETGVVAAAVRQVAFAMELYDLHPIDIETSSAKIDSWESECWRSAPEATRRLFLICKHADREEAEKRVRAWVTEDGPGQLCERTDLRYVLVDPAPGRNAWRGISGWLEVENAFFLFADEAMAKKTVEVLREMNDQVHA